MNFTLGHLDILWDILDSNHIQVKVQADNIMITSKLLTLQEDTLEWSTRSNFIESSGIIQLRHLTSDKSKYTLLTSFRYKSPNDSKVYSGEIGSWN
jgi:hypothetical protein